MVDSSALSTGCCQLHSSWQQADPRFTCGPGDVINRRPATPGVVNRACDTPARLVQHKVTHCVASWGVTVRDSSHCCSQVQLWQLSCPAAKLPIVLQCRGCVVPTGGGGGGAVDHIKSASQQRKVEQQQPIAVDRLQGRPRLRSLDGVCGYDAFADTIRGGQWSFTPSFFFAFSSWRNASRDTFWEVGHDEHEGRNLFFFTCH